MNQDRFRKVILLLVAVIVVLFVFRQGVMVSMPRSVKDLPRTCFEVLRWTFANTPMRDAPEGTSAYVTRADVILALTTIAWMVWLVVRRRSAQSATVSAIVVCGLGFWPIVSFAISAASANWKPPGGLAGVRDVVQHFEYFAVAFALFGSVLSVGGARKMMLFFLIVGAAAMGVGVYLVMSMARGMPMLPELTAAIGFEGWGSHARLAALLAPVFFGLAAFDTNLPRRVFWAAATVASLMNCLYGPLLIAAVVAILVLSMVKSERLFAYVAVVLAALVVCAWSLDFGPAKRELAKGLWLPASDELVVVEDQARLKGEASVMAAAAIRENPLAGVGPGVDIAALTLPRYLRKGGLTDEERAVLADASTPPPYLLAAARMGIPMVVFFLWVFVLFSRRSLSMMTMPGSPLQQGLAVGLFGGLLAFALANFWTPMLLHEIGLGFALILACIWRMSEPETVTAVASEESESRPEEPSSDLLIDLH